jgi:integrase
MSEQKFDVVKSWLDNVAYSNSKSNGTRILYTYYLEKFCKFINKPVDAILTDYSTIEEKEFKRIYAQYLKAIISSQCEICSPKTIDNQVTAVKSFFKYNDLPLGFVPISKSRAMYMNRDITREEIVKIIDQSLPREKAFFAMMAQSGLRPSTLCKLRKKDIEPDFSNDVVPCKIVIPAEITKGNYGKYVTFMGRQSVDYLRLYFESERPNISNEDLVFASYRNKYHKKKATKYDRKGASLETSFNAI